MNAPTRVSIVVFPECDPSIVYGVFDTFWAAGRVWSMLRGEPVTDMPFTPRIVGAARGPLDLITGVTIHVQDAVEDVAETDIVFVPNVMITDAASLRALDRGLIAWIAHMRDAGARVCSACGGSLVLAEAGLLDGLEATTHWGYAALFEREYPAVRLRANRIFVSTGVDQQIVSCGGASSWQDLVLWLIAQHVSAEEAVRLSKIFLYQWHREGQQAYASMIQNTSHGDCIVRDMQAWMAANFRHPHPGAEIVRRSGLSERSFSRRFRSATGYTPIAYVQALRIEEAKQSLERSDAPIEEIGRAVGYEDPASFRRLFKRLSGITPASHRRKFRVAG